MAHFKTHQFVPAVPAGQMPLDPGDRRPIFRFISGDTWRISVNLHNPASQGEPATPDNTVARVVVAETQFDRALWTGEWYDGIMPDERRPGLCYIVMPPDVTDSLRRGSYMFSVKVSDKLETAEETEADGSFLVEYRPTSENHSIPYKDGTSGAGAGGEAKSAGGMAKDVEALKREAALMMRKIRAMSERMAGMNEEIDAVGDAAEAAATAAAEAAVTAGSAEVAAAVADGKAVAASEAAAVADGKAVAATAAAQAAGDAAGEAFSKAQEALDTMAKPYPFETVSLSGGVAHLEPFKNWILDLSDSPGAAVSVEISASDGNMRDLFFEVILGASDTTISWPEGTEPAGEDDANLQPEAGAKNVFLVTEYEAGKFMVARQAIKP